MIEDMKVKAWDKSRKRFLDNNYFKNLGGICLEFINIDGIKKGLMIYEEEDISYMVNFGLKDKNGRRIYGGDYVLVKKDGVEYEQLMPFDIDNYVKECYILSSNGLDIEYVSNYFDKNRNIFLN